MESTQSFRLAGATQIQKIPIQYVDGQSVVYWESIEKAFPGAKKVKNGNFEIPRYIKPLPGVVFDVVLSTTTENVDVDSSVETPSVIPTVAMATVRAVGLTDAPVGPTDSPTDPLIDIPSEDKLVESLIVTSASETPISNIRVCTSSTDYSILPPSAHPKIKATSKHALSFKQVALLALKNEKGLDSQVQMQELRGDIAQMITFQKASDAKQEEIKQLQKQALEHQEEMRLLQEQALAQQEEMKRVQRQALEKQEKMDRLQNEMNQLQIQNQEELRQMHIEAMGQLAVLQSRVQAVLTQTFELHEYPIPRLFIVLPQDLSGWDVMNPFSNKFRLYFLCECG
ncbi:hypothetical protein BGZ98_000345, partial [Dissophora globulifera]